MLWRSLLRVLVLWLFAPLLLTSCGYHQGQGGLSDSYRTISVPYVEEDRDGQLTAAIAKQIAVSGAFEYLHSGGDLILKVIIIDFSEENIGFRYDRNKEGQVSKYRDIIPTETRLTALAEVSVIDACSGTIVLGPARLSSSVDFDHDYYTSRDEINVRSLGQLNDIDAALDAVHRPLNEALAQKIVDYLADSW